MSKAEIAYPPASAIANGGFAAASSAGSAPTAGTNGGKTGPFPRVRTHITYTGTVTAAKIRLYTRLTAGGSWFRGASSDDVAPLQPSASMLAESRDWSIGAGIEFLFVLETITQSTGTVAVAAIGVAS